MIMMMMSGYGGNLMRFFTLLLILLLMHPNIVAASEHEDPVVATDRQRKTNNFFRDTLEISNADDLERPFVDHDSHRELLGMCEGPTEDYYFEVYIRLEPSNGTDMTLCNMADQFLLGNDLNQLLLDFGIGDSGVDEDVIFLYAQVCPKPETTKRGNKQSSGLRKLALEECNFLYTGGAGCRYCLPDNQDRRSLRQLNANWFTDTFAPQLSATMEAAITNSIVPAHPNCLGLDPVIMVELVQVSLQDLNFKCDDGKLIESLDTLGMDDMSLTKHQCQRCVSLDFSKFANGTKIRQGVLIQDQFKFSHGLKITSYGGTSAYPGPHVFDTGDYQCLNRNTVAILGFGSPNAKCRGGGLGVGAGGEPNVSGENCKPIGNVLMMTEAAYLFTAIKLHNSTVPLSDGGLSCLTPNSEGGVITFTWDEPVLISDIGLMNVVEDGQRIKVYYTDGLFETFAYSGFGVNAVQRIIFGKMHVIKVEVIFHGTGAVTEINFCPDCRPQRSHDKDHHCLFTEDGTTIKAQQVVYYANFEAADTTAQHLKWENGRRYEHSHRYEMLTSYLGDYMSSEGAKGTPAPYKVFQISSRAAGVIVDLDFYERYLWTSPHEKLIIYASGEAVDLGAFDKKQDEGWREGTTSLGVQWHFDTIREPGWCFGDETCNDQGHRVKIVVPKSSGLYADGKLRLLLKAEILDERSKAGAGFDNIKVTEIYECHKLA